MRTTYVLASALDYAQRGWSVFLLGRSKRPVANCEACRPTSLAHDPESCPCLTCHGFYAATTDPERIRAMIRVVPDGLLAIRTGAVSGLTVVDIDPGHGGGIDQAVMNPTATVATGGGGWHLYYQHPGFPVRSRPLPDRVGVDIKADGGYVVAPPSIHPITRRPYWWVSGRAIDEMASPLSALVTRASGPRPVDTAVRPRRGFTPHSRGEAISDPLALLAANLETVHRAPKGKRRVTLYGAARGVARIVATGAITREYAEAELIRAGQEAKQTDKQIREAIAGGFRAEGVAL